MSHTAENNCATAVEEQPIQSVQHVPPVESRSLSVHIGPDSTAVPSVHLQEIHVAFTHLRRRMGGVVEVECLREQKSLQDAHLRMASSSMVEEVAKDDPSIAMRIRCGVCTFKDVLKFLHPEATAQDLRRMEIVAMGMSGQLNTRCASMTAVTARQVPRHGEEGGEGWQPRGHWGSVSLSPAHAQQGCGPLPRLNSVLRRPQQVFRPHQQHQHRQL
uniref:Uncharacterized protein n=1 Tax=Tetraselmis sp. GSL018 TaxID=582737 RepID=A0A061RIC1_9CHLO